MRTFEPLRGSLASSSTASNRSPSSMSFCFTTALRAARLAACSSTSARRRLFFSTELFFATTISLFRSLRERHAECREERLGLLVRLRRGAEDDIHPTILVDFVERDL